MTGLRDPAWPCGHGHFDRSCDTCWSFLVALAEVAEERLRELERVAPLLADAAAEISTILTADTRKGYGADDRTIRIRDDLTAVRRRLVAALDPLAKPS